MLATPTGMRMVPPSGTVARVVVHPCGQPAEADGVRIEPPPIYGDVVGLPPPRAGTFHIVSQITALLLRQRGMSRPDVVFPGSGPQFAPVKDQRQRVIAVTALVQS